MDGWYCLVAFGMFVSGLLVGRHHYAADLREAKRQERFWMEAVSQAGDVIIQQRMDLNFVLRNTEESDAKFIN